MSEPEPTEDQAEQRRQAQERRTAASFAFFLVLVLLGSLWLSGVLEWMVRIFRRVAGS